MYCRDTSDAAPLQTPAGKWFRNRALVQPVRMNQDGVMYASLEVIEGRHVAAPGTRAQLPSLRVSFASSGAERVGVAAGINARMRPCIEGGGRKGKVSS